MALDRVVGQRRPGLLRRRPDPSTLADRARDAGQWELAAQLYRKALDRNPRNPPLWVQYGHALKESGNLHDPDKLAQAEIAYRQALSLDPNVADSYLQLGHVLKLQGKTDEAQAAYLRSFALDPSARYPLDELSGLGWSEAQLVEFSRLADGAQAEQAPSMSPRHFNSTVSSASENVDLGNGILSHHRLHGALHPHSQSRSTDPPSPTFSVIIPVHTRTWELQEALDSVLIQSFADLEVIIVTNNSPPDTMAIIERYVQQDPRVRAFYYDNDSGNACRGRNRGIIEARGEFISFLDSDDLYFPDTLKTVYDIFSTHDVDFVAGRASWIVDGSRKVGRMATGDTNQPCAINMAVLMRGNPFMTCTVHIKRDLLLKHGGFRPEQEYYEDLELWLRLAYSRCKFHYADNIIAKYRLHAGNTELKYIAARQHWMAQMRRNYTRPFLEWGI